MLRDQTERKPVETFSPKEFQTFLGVVRPEWLTGKAIIAARHNGSQIIWQT